MQVYCHTIEDIVYIILTVSIVFTHTEKYRITYHKKKERKDMKLWKLQICYQDSIYDH